jgi:hypothetical protein
VNGEDTNVLGGTLVLLTDATTNSPVGTYAIEAGGLSATNYSLSYSNGTLTVTPYALVVSANDTNRSYGAVNPELSGTLVGVQPGDDITASFGTAATTNSGVGTYAITASLADPGNKLGNYSVSSQAGTLTVTPAALVGRADDQTRSYGGTNPVFTATYTGFVNGEDASVLSGDLVGSTDADTNSPVGTYAITVSGQSAANYAVSYQPGMLTVTAAPLVVQAVDASRGYGQANPAFTATYSGFVNGEDTNVLDGTLVLLTDATTNSPVGTYAIEASGLSATNYSLSYSNGTLTVTPYALVVSANDTNRSYGAVNPELSGTLSGVQPGDDITASFGTAATTNSGVGTYAITASLVDPGNKLGNYSVSSQPGTLTVTPAALVGRADDQTRSYGATNPVFTATYTGFVNGEDASVLSGDLVGSTDADTNSPVGTYAITVSGQSAANYAVSYQPGVLTVTAAPLVVQAVDASRGYGQANPAFTATYSGFVNGEDTNVLGGALVLTTDATTNSPVGTYAIEASGLSATNYSLSYSNGTLTITPADSVATLVSSLNPSPFGSNVTFTVTLTAASPGTGTPSGSVQFLTNGVAFGDPATLNGGVAAVSTALLPAGSNTVDVAYAGDGNFLGTNTSLVQVVSIEVQPPTTVGIKANGDGTVTATFQGTPAAQYVVQATTNLAPPVTWSNVSTNTAGADGTWSFSESTTGYTQRFFRPVKP